MASFDDLGRALRDDAEANAPRASAINVNAVIAAARTRRRPRQWGVGALALVGVLGLGGIAVAAATPPVLFAASESADGDQQPLSDESATVEGGVSESAAGDRELSEGSPERAADLLGCGAEAPSAAQSPGAQSPGAQSLGDLTLKLRLPAVAPAGADAIEGVVLLTNTGTAIVTVMTSTEAVGVLAKAGIVVGNTAAFGEVGLEFLLAPGESRELTVRIPIDACDPANSAPLAAGDYTVIALLEVAGSTPGTRALVVAPAAAVRLD